jgi:hypothetical protein
MVQFTDQCTVDYLVQQVNNRCLNPDSQNTFEPADLINIMDSELSNYCVPLLKKVKQEFFVTYFDQPITGATSYQIPPRAIGNALRDVVFVDASGNEIALSNLLPEYTKTTFPLNSTLPLYVFGQFMKGDQIVLYPQQVQNDTGYKLRMKVERRPGALTSITNCGQVVAITGNVVTLSNIDPTWTTSTLFDCINNFPPFNSVGDDQTITNITGFQLTFTSVPTGLAIGMYVCPRMMSCIPQIPYENFGLLIERTIIRVAEALDMSVLLQAAKQNYKEMEDNMLVLERPRISGSPQKCINRNRPSQGGGYGSGWVK